MAINPHIPQVPAVKDPATYPAELYNSGHMDGVPSFFEFLTEHRGLPDGFFTPEELHLAALNTELVFYNAFVQKIQQSMAQDIDLSEKSLEELSVYAAQLKSMLRRAEDEMQKASQEIAAG